MLTPPPLPPPTPSTPAYGYPPRADWRVGSIIAWILIGLIAIGLPILNELGKRTLAKPSTQPAGKSMQLVMSGQYTLQAAKLFGNKEQLLSQADSQAKTPDDWIASAILHGELLGREPAIERLSAMNTPDADEVLKLHGNPHAAASPGNSFATRYPWYADLARAHGTPEDDPLRKRVYDEAMRTFVVIVAGFSAVALLIGAGGILLTVAVILLYLKKLRFAMPVPSGPWHTYVEGFAAYLVTMVVGSVALQLVGSALKVDLPLPASMLPLALATMVGIAWPIARGASWDVLKRDLGLHTGRGVLAEVGAGIVGYVACLPILAVFILLFILLVHFTGDVPTHPLTDQAEDLSPLVMFFIAAVFAPVTEELIFRGLLLSNLRGAMPRVAGFVLGPLIVGYVFASIHPQGWMAIPVLMAIGACFALIRFWRGSLIAPIVGHALHNGAIVTFMVVMLSM